jgi:hypothetical protein
VALGLGWDGPGEGQTIRRVREEPGRPEVWGKTTPTRPKRFAWVWDGVELGFTRSPLGRMMDPVVSLG